MEMCSTPKPKQKVKGKSVTNVVSILASLDGEARKKFAQRANQAYEHRCEVKAQEQAPRNTPIKSQKKTKRLQRSWLYWLLSASITEILSRFFHLQKN
jgi:hypothetical protein